MATQTTKKERLADLFNDARVDLPDHLFANWLSYCYGVFEYAAGANRKVNRYDITLIAKELADRRDECKNLEKTWRHLKKNIEKKQELKGD